MNSIYFKCTECEKVEALFIEDSVWEFDADNLETNVIKGTCNSCKY